MPAVAAAGHRPTTAPVTAVASSLFFLQALRHCPAATAGCATQTAAGRRRSAIAMGEVVAARARESTYQVSLISVPKYVALPLSWARPTKRGAIAKSPPDTHRRRRRPRPVRPRPLPGAGRPHPSSSERAACAGTLRAHPRASAPARGGRGAASPFHAYFFSATGTGCVADSRPYTSMYCTRRPLAVPAWGVVRVGGGGADGHPRSTSVGVQTTRRMGSRAWTPPRRWRARPDKPIVLAGYSPYRHVGGDTHRPRRGAGGGGGLHRVAERAPPPLLGGAPAAATAVTVAAAAGHRAAGGAHPHGP